LSTPLGISNDAHGRRSRPAAEAARAARRTFAGAIRLTYYLTMTALCCPES
jgi:hypothetical protein